MPVKWTEMRFAVWNMGSHPEQLFISCGTLGRSLSKVIEVHIWHLANNNFYLLSPHQLLCIHHQDWSPQILSEEGICKCVFPVKKLRFVPGFMVGKRGSREPDLGLQTTMPGLPASSCCTVSCVDKLCFFIHGRPPPFRDLQMLLSEGRESDWTGS